MLRTDNLSLSYGDHHSLKDINIEIKKGETLTLVGRNGVGKSTLLRCLTGVEVDIQGEVYFKDKNLKSWTRKSLAQEMAFMSQEILNTEGLTVTDFIEMSRFSHSDPAPQNASFRLDNILKDLKLDHLADRQMSTLSSGEFQKAHLASVIYQTPEIVVLDEPFAFVDPAFQDEIQDFLWKLKNEAGLTIVMVLHDLNRAASYSDKVVGLIDGRVCFNGSGEELLDNTVLKELFNKEFQFMNHPQNGKKMVLPA